MKGNKRIQKIAYAVTHWVGSPLSILLHTILFIAAIVILVKGIFSFDVVILILNTTVSLEAIYLALFIQMTVNFQAESIEGVSEDIEEMQEDIGEIAEDVDELQEDVEEINEDETEDEHREAEQKKTLTNIQTDLRKLMADIEKLQSK
jgi:low affinity Fe/Cu permease